MAARPLAPESEPFSGTQLLRLARLATKADDRTAKLSRESYSSIDEHRVLRIMAAGRRDNRKNNSTAVPSRRP